MEPLTADQLAHKLASLTISGSDKIATSQERHRLALLEHWFGSLGATYNAISGGNVLEIGCGQGDMTVALANFVQGDVTVRGSSTHQGKVFAIDPAPLGYGAPYTLCQAQSHLSSSSLGPCIQWVQDDPIEYLNRPSAADSLPRYIVLAHSIFYMETRAYFERLLKAIGNAYAKVDVPPTLLVAEWGMRSSCAAAEPHVLAVKAQLANPVPDGNVRTVICPNEIQAIAEKCEWSLQREAWIASPEIDDGSWEVDAARGFSRNEDLSHAAAALLRQMEDSIARSATGKVQSMDVWTAVFNMKRPG